MKRECPRAGPSCSTGRRTNKPGRSTTLTCWATRCLWRPLLGGAKERWVYLPEGRWYSLSTGECYQGKQRYLVTAEPGDVPVFVKDNTILPLAKPVQSLQEDTVFELTARVYGDSPRPRTLIADDGTTYAFVRGEKNRVTLSWDPKTQTGSVSSEGGWNGTRYKVVAWDKIESKPAAANSAKENLVGHLADAVPPRTEANYRRNLEAQQHPTALTPKAIARHLLDDVPGRALRLPHRKRSRRTRHDRPRKARTDPLHPNPQPPQRLLRFRRRIPRQDPGGLAIRRRPHLDESLAGEPSRTGVDDYV